jgi:hypothetical protein
VLFISSISTSSRLFFLLLVLPAPLFGQQAAARKQLPVLPIIPSELSAAMPGMMKGWKLKQATAKNTYTKWIQTRATRVFESEPKQKGEKPLTVRIKLTDTGRFYPSIQFFFSSKNLNGDAAGAGPARKRLAGLRGSEQVFPDGRKQVRALFDERFIIELLLPAGVNDAQVDLFLSHFNFNVLKGKKGKPVKRLPPTYTMRSIDELKPQRNRSYQMAIITAEEVKQMLDQILAVDPSIAEDEEGQ